MTRGRGPADARRSAGSRAVRGVARLLVAVVVSGLIGVLAAALALPVVAGSGLAAKDQLDGYLVLPTDLDVPALAQRTEILAADGSLLARLFLQNRVPVSWDDVPEHARQAVLAIEDSRFYEHRGVDVKGTVRAALKNSASGGVQQGGSTLTQQYVKNALLLAADTDEERLRAREVSVERKLREARYAMALEREVGKDEILLRYLNIAYYGNGVYGLGAAADHYFSTTAKSLTVTQSALLAGLVQSPERLNPSAHPEAALERRNTVLARMAELGHLDDIAAKQAEPLGLRLRPTGSGCEAPQVRAPFFCDYVRRALEDGPLGVALGSTREERQARLLGGGLTIRTTLDPAVQRVAQDVVSKAVPSNDPSGVAMAFTAVQPGTGHVQSLVVNRRFGADKKPGHTKVNLALGGSSGMQAGSTFKPFVLAAALQQGLPLDTTFLAPARYTSKAFTTCDAGRCGLPYEISNAGDSNAGVHDVVSGTHGSVNTFYLQLLEKTGVEQPAGIAERLGLQQFRDGTPTGPLHRGGSFVLGANEVSPLDMAAAYAAFAARGTWCPPRPVTEVLDADGRQVPLPEQDCEQVLEPELADRVTSVLRGTIDGPSPFRTARRADLGRPAAGKTGSTNGSKAAWFAGYVPQLAASVWVGKPEPQPLQRVTINGKYYKQVYGGTLPAPVWGEVMRTVLAGLPPEPLPPHAVSTPQGAAVTLPGVPSPSPAT